MMVSGGASRAQGQGLGRRGYRIRHGRCGCRMTAGTGHMVYSEGDTSKNRGLDFHPRRDGPADARARGEPECEKKIVRVPRPFCTFLL